MMKKSDRSGGVSSFGWRQYQDRLKREAARRKLRFRAARWLAAAAVVAVAAAALLAIDTKPDRAPEKAKAPAAGRPPSAGLAKDDLRQVLPASAFFNLQKPGLEIRVEDRRYHVETSLNMSLQQRLFDLLDRRNSRYIGIVALDPGSGRVLAMVGYDKTGSGTNPCVDRDFPAASVFKIVTAAAAIEELGLMPEAAMTYNGRKHTLYKSQLQQKQNRYTNRTTFRKSFAQSINPVFGKIGVHRLGQDLLAKYAEAFGFNRAIAFETPIAASSIQITDEPYQWAEVASGFNRDTRISTLHGALIASVVINGGRLIEPTVVERVTDADGRVVYTGQSAQIQPVISFEASRRLADLMKATVVSGTSRSAFRGSQRDWVLSKLEIGGKTGSINSRDNGARYDWFVGYAFEKEGTAQMAVSAVVAHEKFIGRRASAYARQAIRHYFQEAFARRAETPADAPG